MLISYHSYNESGNTQTSYPIIRMLHRRKQTPLWISLVTSDVKLAFCVLICYRAALYERPSKSMFKHCLHYTEDKKYSKPLRKIKVILKSPRMLHLWKDDYRRVTVLSIPYNFCKDSFSPLKITDILKAISYYIALHRTTPFQ